MTAREKVAKAINPNHPDIALHIADAAIAAHLEALKADGYAIIKLPEPYPDDTVHPYWSIDDINGPQIVGVTDSDGDSEYDWVSIQFTARWRTVDAQTARKLGAALVAAAEAAEAQR